jgi:hypothetical protein
MADVDLTDLEIVRFFDGPKVFGLKLSALRDAILKGLIPKPIPLTSEGRSLGWTRGMIRQHHAKMAKLAAERAKLQPEPPALRAARTKTIKKKLRPPGGKKHEPARRRHV